MKKEQKGLCRGIELEFNFFQTSHAAASSGTTYKLYELRRHLHEQGHDLRYELEYKPQATRLASGTWRVKGGLKYHHRIEDKRHHRKFQLKLACAKRGYHQSNWHNAIEHQS
jgi:hypothetical protein